MRHQDSRLNRVYFCCAATVLPVTCLLGSNATAALTEVDAASTVVRSQSQFDAAISNSDLIQNGSTFLSGAPVTTGNVAGYGGDVAPFNSFDHLTDGLASSKITNNDISHDTFFDSGALGATPAPSITYNFNTAASPAGYTLTSINTINGWADNNQFSYQKYIVSVSYVGAPSTFTEVAAVDYNPYAGIGDGQNSSQVTLMDSATSVLSGVAAIKFAFLPQGGMVIREIDVQGAPTSVPEPTTLGLIGIAGSALLARRRSR